MNAVKKAALLLSTVLAVAVCTGCHGARGLAPFEMPEAFDTAKEQEITFWAKNDTNKAQTQIYETTIEAFEKLYPNIHVNIRLYTDYGKIYNDVITNIATNTTPDVCITYPDHIATYLTGKNVVVPLDALMEDAAYGLGGSELRFDAPAKEEVVQTYLEECRIGERCYALPFMRSTEACYVNRDYVEKLGYTLPETLTWDFVWEVSEAALEKQAEGLYRVNGQKIMIPFIYKSTDNMMIQLLRQSGGGYSNADGEVLIFNDTTREILRTIARHAKTGAFSTFKISSYPANFLNAGQCIFAVDSTAGSTWMGTKAPLSDISADKLVDFETAVMTVPQMDPEAPVMISQGPSVCVFNKEDPQRVLAAWLFAQYLLTDTVQIAYAETEGYVPVTTRAQGAADYREYLSHEDADAAHYEVKIKATKLLLAHVNDTFVTPVYNGSASLRDAAGQMIENVTKSVRRKEAVDEAYLDKLFSDVTSLYRLDTAARSKINAGEKEELGPLPDAAIALLTTLGAAWVLLAATALSGRVKQRRR